MRRKFVHPLLVRHLSPSSARAGNVVWAILAIVAFLAIFGGIKYATRPAPEIQVIEMKRVNGKTLGGTAISMKSIQSILSAEATGGLGGISARLRTSVPEAGADEKDADDKPENSGTEGIESKLVNVEQDGNGEFLMVHLRLSRDYLEKQGKISNLLAVVSTPDIQLTRSGGGSVEPIFLVLGLREQTKTPKGDATQFNFGGGNTFTTHSPVPNELWMATGQIKQAQELSSTVDVVCLFGRPPGDGALSLQVLGTPNVALQ